MSEPADEQATWEVRWAASPGAEPARELTATIDGHPVTVSCTQPLLRHRPEAWATAFAFAAARAGATLDLAEPIDPTWEAGAGENVATAARWWGGSATLPLRTPPQRPAARRSGSLLRRFGRRAPQRAGRGRALCFTGGVDSFYALIAGDHAPTHLLYVHGFDVDLDDAPRQAAISRSLRAVADAKDLQLVELTSDLRRHPRFDSISWEETHGSALVALAMLAANEIEVLAIPPSHSDDRMTPWGSHPDLDGRWAIPGVLSIEHGDITEHRRERTAAIVHDPLVHQHLRVCWEHRNAHLNCGACEKCLRTMTALASLGVLEACRSFPSGADLATGIDQIPKLGPGVRASWRDLLGDDLPPEVISAIERLVSRPEPER